MIKNSFFFFLKFVWTERWAIGFAVVFSTAQLYRGPVISAGDAIKIITYKSKGEEKREAE